MLVRWLVAAVHLLALGIGFAALSARMWALADVSRPDRLRLALTADSFWGLAALLWIGTGLWRVFGGLEKGTAFYMGSGPFWIKMALLGGIILLEILPMITLIRWRIARSRGRAIFTAAAPHIVVISAVQLVLLIGMIFVATAMARGVWT
jgi:putative membrane protein